MEISKQQRIYFWGMLLGIYLLAGWIQSTLTMQADVSVLMHETMRFLAGGIYGKDFYEPTPPLIFYVCLLPVLTMKLFHLSLFAAWQGYLFLLASISLFVCHRLSKKIFLNGEHSIVPVLILTLAAIFLILPLDEFGQRDCLVVILTMPYLFLLACRLEGKSVSGKLACLVGLMGVIGFSIKPQYLLALFLLEGYGVYCERRILSMMRIETLVVFSCLVIYLASIFLFQPGYVFQLVPLVSRVYYTAVETSWMSLLSYPPALYCGLPLLLFLMRYKKTPHKKLSTLFLIAMMSEGIVYWVQNSLWYSHIIPAFSMAIFLLMLLLIFFQREVRVARGEYVGLAFLSLLLLGCFAYWRETLWVSILFYHWQYQFFMMLAVGILLFSVFLRKESSDGFHFACGTFFGILFFAFPIYESHLIYASSLKRTAEDQKLIAYLQSHAKNQSVYFLSSRLSAYPFVDYAGVTNVSRYPILIWVPSLAKHTMQEKDKIYYLESVAEDFKLKKPNWVFVDANFDYMGWFLENNHFKNLWKSYRYVATFENVPAYSLAVYERIDSARTRS